MIDFKNVTKMLGGKSILDDVSFRISRGERIGLVGPNGTGKTTVFGMICNEITPDKGEILIPDKLRIGLLHQQLNLTGCTESALDFAAAANGELPKMHERMLELEATLEANPADANALQELGQLQTQYEHLGGYDSEHRAEMALAGLGFAPEVIHNPISSFSGGWQMRAAMARVLLGEPDVLLLDEPSNYLDIPAVEWLQKRLKLFTGTLVLVSHDRFLLNTLTDVTLEMNGGKITRYSGNYNHYMQEREGRIALAESIRKNNAKKREKLKENIEKFRYKVTKAAQVQMWLKMLEKMDEEPEQPENLHFQGKIRIPDPPRCGAQIFSVEGLEHTYDGSRYIFRGLDFSVENGEKLGIVGYNGMGKTTLLRIIAGTLKPSGGTVHIGHNVLIGYQAQDFAELLPPEQCAYDVVKQAAPGDVPPSRVREILGAFGFSGDDAMKLCKVLSGGEKIRLSFARIFVNPPNLLILDEPTTHLDVSAREALQAALATYAGTVCFVSHDLEFLRGTATTILEMRPGRIRKYYGNYAYYKEKLEEEERLLAAKTNPQPRKEEPSTPAQNASSAADDLNQKERRKLKASQRNAMLPQKRRLEREIAKLEQTIEKAENEKNEIAEQLIAAGPQTDYAALQKRIKDLDYTISEATINWDSVTAEYEAFMQEYDKLA